MKFYWISWSWRTGNEEVERDVQSSVTEIIQQGNGIVTWWALGVDYIATEIARTLGDPATQLRVYLPIALEKFCAHYEKRAKEWVITSEQAQNITAQLRMLSIVAPDSIYDTTPFTLANEESYYARNKQIVEACDALLAFHVNNTSWVQDAIDQATALGKSVTVKTYKIEKK